MLPSKKIDVFFIFKDEDKGYRGLLMYTSIRQIV